MLLIVLLAAFVVDRARQLRERETTALVMLAALVPAMLVIAEPDLGSGLVYVTIAFDRALRRGRPLAPPRGPAGAGRRRARARARGRAGGGRAGAEAPTRSQRLTAFLHPTDNPGDTPEEKTAYELSYQQLESKIAIGAGGRTGAGPGATQIKGEFVPEDSTDLVFAAVGERYGFVGAALVLSLYALMIWRTLRILTPAKDLFGALVAAGVVAMLLFQVFVNVGVAVDILPVTGVTLPLMSYGGSSVLATFLALGLLQSIYVQARAARL